MAQWSLCVVAQWFVWCGLVSCVAGPSEESVMWPSREYLWRGLMGSYVVWPPEICVWCGLMRSMCGVAKSEVMWYGLRYLCGVT